VSHKPARTLVVLTLLALALGQAARAAPPDGETPAPRPERVVFLGSGLSGLDLVTFTATVAAGAEDAVVLLDSEKCTPYTRAFLAAYHADRVVPVGTFPLGVTDLRQRLDTPTAPEVAWPKGRPAGLWRLLFPRASRVVVCPAEPRGLLLQSACLAGALKAPLFVLDGAGGGADELRDWLTRWHAHTVYAAGGAAEVCRGLRGVTAVELADEREVSAAYLRAVLRQGPVTSLVVTNPEDLREGFGGMSVLAPWVALRRRAALLCTDPAGDDAEDVVRAALRNAHLRRADALILVANLRAIPMGRRPNPIPGDKDPDIEMEPFTPAGDEPFTFATGRLFHEDPAVVPLLLARERMLLEGPTPRKALVVSNPGGSLPLLETFSRNTAKELHNAGYDTTVRFGRTTSGEELRRLLPEHDLFLWEGHQSTLIRDWSLPDWDEPLPPSLVFLQSCLALQDWKAQPLLRRGAVGVLGSSTRTYSASGGATSLAFFDALLYDQQSLGGSLRQAKNFLAVYARLKEKRLGKDAKRTGANLRAAWAFTLWGDPTLRLPLPEPPADALPPVRHEVEGNTIVLALPAEHHGKVTTSRFQVEMYPNGRLAGLCRKEADDDGLPLVPFVFAEVALPKGRSGQVPELHSRLPSSHWVFSWDERRRCGYLIAVPRAKDRDELRFTVHWAEPARDGAAGGE
jgi:hypothetical protein